MLRSRSDSTLRSIFWIALITVPPTLSASIAWCASTYSLRVLGTLAPDNGGYSFAEGINDAGVVVGGATDAGGSRNVFRWSPADGMTNCGEVVPPFQSYGAEINSAGVLCGSGETRSNGFGAGFRQVSNGNLEALSSLAGAGDWYAYAISEGNRIVGWSNTSQGCGSPTCPGNPGHAVSWSSDGAISILPDLGGYCSAATDITPDGSKICGYGANPAGQIHAFRLVGNVVTELPPLPSYDQSFAFGVNTAGQVVGYSASGNTLRATLWNVATPIDLGTTGDASGSIALRISESGVIIGYVTVAGPGYRAMTFEAGSGPTDLNTRLDDASPWTLSYCNGINSGGQIVGAADSSGVSRAFVLTPVTASTVAHSLVAASVELRPPTPNPSTGDVELRLSLATAEYVRLSILDMSGRLVAEPADQWMEAGDYVVSWNGRDAHGRRVTGGVYLVRLSAGGNTATRKFIVRK